MCNSAATTGSSRGSASRCRSRSSTAEPLYVKRLHELAADPSRPWLSKIIEEGQGEAERSLGELASLASNRPSITLATLEFATAARSGLPFVEPDLFMPPPRFSV
jgi:hypothetical protein